MHDPYAPHSRPAVEPLPDGRLVAIGTPRDVVDYWRDVWASLDDTSRAALAADWAALSDDELAADVALAPDDAPDPAEAGSEWTPLDVPRAARDVVAWIAAARGSEQQHRAEAALVVEQQRATQRVTVLDAAREVIGA